MMTDRLADLLTRAGVATDPRERLALASEYNRIKCGEVVERGWITVHGHPVMIPDQMGGHEAGLHEHAAEAHQDAASAHQMAIAAPHLAAGSAEASRAAFTASAAAHGQARNEGAMHLAVNAANDEAGHGTSMQIHKMAAEAHMAHAAALREAMGARGIAEPTTSLKQHAAKMAVEAHQAAANAHREAAEAIQKSVAAGHYETPSFNTARNIPGVASATQKAGQRVAGDASSRADSMTKTADTISPNGDAAVASDRAHMAHIQSWNRGNNAGWAKTAAERHLAAAEAHEKHAASIK